MVIRLVQTFKNFRLAMEDHPESLPPPEWKAGGVGRKAIEKVNLKSHLTIYAKVKYILCHRLQGDVQSHILTLVPSFSQDGLWVKMDEA